MDSEQHDKTTDDLSILIDAVAYLGQQLGGMREKSPEEQVAFLQALGLSPRISAEVRDRFKNIPVYFHRNVPDIPPVAPIACPIGWGPSIFRPVFYGYRDYDAADGAPGRLRVFYPTLDGAPEGAPFLAGCGNFPLVLFLHGHCSEQDHYQKWFFLPAQVARCGYVVAVPELPQISGGTVPWEADSDLALAENVQAWMRRNWTHRHYLMLGTGIVGHSRGALLGARLMPDLSARLLPLGAKTAYVSLSGSWQEWPDVPPRPLNALGAPALFTSGTGIEDQEGQLSDARWNEVAEPKHRLTFVDGGHWDYLSVGLTTCELLRGPCNVVQWLAGDFAATFLSKYVWPEESGILPGLIEDSLIPQSVSLTPEQQFYAAGHLIGLQLIGSRAGCSATQSWETPDGAGSVSLP